MRRRRHNIIRGGDDMTQWQDFLGGAFAWGQMYPRRVNAYGGDTKRCLWRWDICTSQVVKYSSPLRVEVFSGSAFLHPNIFIILLLLILDQFRIRHWLRQYPEGNKYNFRGRAIVPMVNRDNFRWCEQFNVFFLIRIFACTSVYWEQSLRGCVKMYGHYDPCLSVSSNCNQIHNVKIRMWSS